MLLPKCINLQVGLLVVVMCGLDIHAAPEDLTDYQRAGDYDEEYRIIRPDGSIRWIRDRAFPVKDEAGNVYRIAGLAEDITRASQ